MFKKMIEDGIKYTNFEKIEAGKMTIKKVSFTQTTHQNDIILFEGTVINSKGVEQPITVSKDARDDEAMKFAVGTVVRALLQVEVSPAVITAANNLDDLLAIANEHLIGKVLEFETIKTRNNGMVYTKRQFKFSLK